jgi:hypothetical protein
MINQQMHIYKYVQSHIVILHQHISAAPVTIRVAYNKNTINIQIIVQRYMMLQLICKSNVPPNSFIIYFCTIIFLLTLFLSQATLIMVTRVTETR